MTILHCPHLTPPGICSVCQRLAVVEAELANARREIERLQKQVMDYMTDPLDDEQCNIGADLAADRLREIAENGRTSGVFGGEKMEAAAQAILKLRKALEGK